MGDASHASHVRSRTYADQVKGKQQLPTTPIDLSSLPLPTLKEGKPAVVLPESFYLEGCDIWRFSLIGHLDFKGITFQEVKDDLEHQWQLKVWVTIRILDRKNVLLSLAKSLGTPIVVDRRTLAHEYGHFASVLVDINFSEAATDAIHIAVGGLDFWQSVEIQKIPKYCSKCKLIGHTDHECRKQHKENTERQLVVSKQVSVEESQPGVSNIPQAQPTGGEWQVARRKKKGKKKAQNANVVVHDVVDNIAGEEADVEYAAKLVKDQQLEVVMAQAKAYFESVFVELARTKQAQSSKSVLVKNGKVDVAESSADAKFRADQEARRVRMQSMHKVVNTTDGRNASDSESLQDSNLRNCVEKGSSPRINSGSQSCIATPVVMNSSRQAITIETEGVLISFVHASCFRVTRRSLWQQLCSVDINTPWLVMGDFNCVLRNEEKRGGRPKRAPFRVQKMWFSHSHFMRMVSESWNAPITGTPAFIFPSKLKRLKVELKDCNLRVFGNVYVKLKQAQLTMEVALTISDEDPEDVIKLNYAKEASVTLQEIRSQQATKLKQKSRNKWLLEGASNTSLFHANIRTRRSSNMISELVDDNGVVLTDCDQIRDHTVAYFEAKFNGAELPIDDALFQYDHNIISVEDSQRMDEIPTIEEIKNVVFDLGADSAPGPDGFSGCFYRTFSMQSRIAGVGR
ncbi:uncharacterized protein LOC113316036 [Papaver somniferum]|uniref:uncharacterized protein LOC113316036 n=1 Tax=Papaver somniferum TaxID=3469 RepID=UPI000E7022FA|nr:uncharacterized protein LOC113316036 [Papaver somniferum]